VLSDLPEATLAAIVVVAVAGLISVAELRRIARIDRVELLVAVLTGLVALVTNLLVGVLAGVLLTFYLVLRTLNHPRIVELRRPPGGSDLEPARSGDEEVPGLLALRIEGGLYTMNVRSVQAQIVARVDAAEPRPRVVLVDVRGTADTSVTVMDVFAETDQQLARRGVALWMAALPTAALAKARRTAAWPVWRDAGKLHASNRDALAAFDRIAARSPDPDEEEGSR
jgi:sulfate permease, SulP family